MPQGRFFTSYDHETWQDSVDAGLAAPVDTAKLVDNAVTTAKIADLAVTTAKIADANVTTAKIADAAATLAKLDRTGALGRVPLAQGPGNAVIWGSPRRILGVVFPVSGAAVTFTNLPPCQAVAVMLDFARSSAIAHIRIRLSSDNGTTWTPHLQVSAASGAAAAFFNGVIDIEFADVLGAAKTVVANIGIHTTGVPVTITPYAGPSSIGLNVINAVEISPSAGVFNNGAIRIYGIA